MLPKKKRFLSILLVTWEKMSESDRENSNKENSDEKNSNEESSGKKI